MEHWINKLEDRIGKDYALAVVQVVACAALAAMVLLGNWNLMF